VFFPLAGGVPAVAVGFPKSSGFDGQLPIGVWGVGMQAPSFAAVFAVDSPFAGNGINSSKLNFYHQFADKFGHSGLVDSSGDHDCDCAEFLVRRRGSVFVQKQAIRCEKCR
jgi:hypothetical protein